jgi:hypothetical protein
MHRELTGKSKPAKSRLRFNGFARQARFFAVQIQGKCGIANR